MFPNQGGGGGGGGDRKGKPPAKQGPGGQQQLHHPPVPMGPKPGQGMNPMEAMMFGMGDMSQFAPPAPQAPMGPGGLPVGGNLASSDPGMDPAMQGSSLFKALNIALSGGGADPYGSPPAGHGMLDPPPGSQPGLEQLLALLALSQGGLNPMDAGPLGMGMGAPGASGVMNEPTHPGETIGLNPFGVIQ